jgi:hypothetical protein
MDESQYYTKDFWYNQLDKHDGPGYDTIHNYGPGYYAYKLYERLIPQLDIPNTGAIVVLGTHRCVSFNLLCKKFGDRCLGFDIANPTNHPKVLVHNVMNLTADIPIAFVHNDIGNFTYTPKAKLHAQEWATKNVISGGYMLGRNDRNSRDYPLEQLAISNGFINTQLEAYRLSLQDIDSDTITGHMISKKK